MKKLKHLEGGEKCSCRVSDKLKGTAIKQGKEGPHEGLKIRSMKASDSSNSYKLNQLNTFRYINILWSKSYENV